MIRRTVLVCFLVTAVMVLPAAAQQVQPQPPPGVFAPPDPQPAPLSADTFLSQPVTLTGCAYSDTTRVQIIAEDVVVSGGMPVAVDEILVWAIYHPNNTPPGVNSPMVRFYSDSGGLPGTLLAQESSVPTAIIDTGLDDGVWNLDVYELTLSLVTPVELAPGTWWVEVTENTGDTSNLFCWEFGQLDPTNGRVNGAIARSEPPQSWIASSNDSAIQLNGQVVPVELQSFEIDR